MNAKKSSKPYRPPGVEYQDDALAQAQAEPEMDDRGMPLTTEQAAPQAFECKGCNYWGHLRKACLSHLQGIPENQPNLKRVEDCPGYDPSDLI